MQQAYQTVLEESLWGGLRKVRDTVNKAIIPEPVDRFVKSAADKMSKTFLDPWMKKKPAPQSSPAADPNAAKQQAQDRFHMKVSDAAEQAGFTATEDDRLGATGFKSKSTGKVVQIIFQTNSMDFYENNKSVGKFKLTYSDDDADRAIAFMKGEEYVDPEDKPWTLHPSDPRR